MRTSWSALPDDPRVVDMRTYLTDADLGRSTIEGDASAGQQVFRATCGECHGDDGHGVEGKAGALNDPALLALMSDSMLRRMAVTGREDLDMPPLLEKLRPRDVADVVAFIGTWRDATLDAAQERATP